MASANSKTRLKAAAQVYVPQTKDDAASDIHKIGELQRGIARMQADMNDQIADVTATYQPTLEALNAKLKVMQQGVQAWCEGHRAELTNDGKVKTANLVTGEVQWRQRPPSVGVRGAEAVIEALKRLGLGKFVRTKEEVAKDVILNEPEAVRGVAGITIVSGVEDFIITPFERVAA